MRLIPKRGAAIPEFRAFELTREGHIITVAELHCDEDEAKACARKLAINAPVEFWKGPRRMALRATARAVGSVGRDPSAVWLLFDGENYRRLSQSARQVAVGRLLSHHE